MKMEIISPQENGFLTEIKWNNKQLLQEITKKTADYTNAVYTGDNWLKAAKADRADLNKLRKTIEDERKRIKGLCMAPYETFETQVKEVLVPIDTAIQSIDKQVKAAEEAAKAEKQQQIEELFTATGFQDFVELDMIFNPKWLNKSYSLTTIKEELEAKKYEVGRDVLAIHQLSEYSFEAMDYYKRTLNLAEAMQEAARLASIQRRKEEAAKAEEERRRLAEQRRAEAEAARAQQLQQAQQNAQPAPQPQPVQQPAPAEAPAPAPAEDVVHQVDFRVWGTREQIRALALYIKNSGMKYGKVE